VRLVADDEVVRLAVELRAVTSEPRVGLDRDRVLERRRRAREDRIREAISVSLGREVALELGDEEPAVGQDEDAQVASRLDEPGCGDRLSGRRRVAEAVAANGARVGARVLLDLEFPVLDEAGVVVVLRLVVEVDLSGTRTVASAVPLPFPFSFSSAARCVAAINSASIPVRASIWCRRSSVPAAVRAGSSVRTRSRPSMSP
jgi:hypothetical protein